MDLLKSMKMSWKVPPTRSRGDLHNPTSSQHSITSTLQSTTTFLHPLPWHPLSHSPDLTKCLLKISLWKKIKTIQCYLNAWRTFTIISPYPSLGLRGNGNTCYGLLLQGYGPQLPVPPALQVAEVLSRRLLSWNILNTRRDPLVCPVAMCVIVVKHFMSEY